MTEWKHSINSYVRTYDGESVKYFNGKFEFWGLKKEQLDKLLEFESTLISDDDD